jgi:hypothetical protein
MVGMTDRFRKVFMPRIKRLDLKEYSSQDQPTL